MTEQIKLALILAVAPIIVALTALFVALRNGKKK
jgi:hypothetical protein